MSKRVVYTDSLHDPALKTNNNNNNNEGEVNEAR